MSAPRVLFVTDDRESYSRGNYYLAYQRAAMRNANVTLAHPLESLPDPSRFDVVVLGHAAIENYARLRGSRFLPAPVRLRLWFRHAGLRALRRTRTPIVLFTKNDYKQFDLKNAFISYVEPDLVVTHTRSALQRLIAPHGRLIWMPFGVDPTLFEDGDASSAARPFAVGFRANANAEWNDGERERFYRALGRLERQHRVSLSLSTHGEGFLLGKAYADWMRSCTVIGNTVSAAGTVGPRFLEAMACDTVTIAPRHPYENLLEPDKHYVPVDAGPDGSFPELEAAVARFFGDPAYRELLRHQGRALVSAHTVDKHVLHVFREAGV